MGASGPHFGAPRVGFRLFSLLFQSLSALFVSLFYLASLFYFSSYSSLLSSVVSLQNALVSLLASRFSSISPAARRFSRSDWDPPRRCTESQRVTAFGTRTPLRSGDLYKDQKSLLLGRPNPRNRLISNLSYFTALLFTFRAEPLRNSRSGQFAKSSRELRRPSPRDPRNRRMSPQSAPKTLWSVLFPFSALFSLLLCLFSSSRAVLVPFWPHFGTLGTTTT